jgi:hypothetical protein
MADQTGLRVIGIGFSAVTAAVALIAAFIVVGTTPDTLEARPAIVNASMR